MLKVTDLRIGKFIELDNAPFEVLEYSHSKLGRGGAIVKTKLRNLRTGATIDKTFKGQERVEEASLSSSSCQYLYSDAQEFYFMDLGNFNQFTISRESLGNKTNFLKEGDNIDVTFLDDKEPININLPIKVNFKITETEPGVKGDTASSATKEAIIETGFKLHVPLFIKIGDVIKIDTRTGDYLERVN
ncbi:elongation factor P [bacterium CG_4_10_14_0_2_um_filter_33_32]|nr:MAG: elongation factor P [bacterium CG2_30_33_46]PIR67807.1 MAG: elongation factor P [bacterium CG10_big_fil_rev_8_21_14_0_10_33_18]PIU76834.1 MAG: elongation factor P [bacterium CG06_land_8_20_14_3_00_33_50]PIW81633.1 MAG: elongation factor P [bacterium CG_4_8_14_3_um_filter_33_28]PIY85509.1 MAG: elongation factor P [bacterium CG_4_10_14_0_8_um_filter_33_57]PIZ85488.1 MAG: elongation factor P [bacterium CG_4_10_14_0_2_um_filter_33_32]PJA72383.1 MAG: elongation factor P [bacterium CG_4_9_1